MKINEIFTSIQGESLEAGYVTTFIRLQGCNLRCKWCDTLYAREIEGGKEMTPEDVAQRIHKETKHICITGGEPLLQPFEVQDLAVLLKEKFPSASLQLQTNGSYWIGNAASVFGKIIMDWKTPSSGINYTVKRGNILWLRSNDEVNFVINTEEDYDFAVAILKEHKAINKLTTITFTPAWNQIHPKMLAEWMLRDNLRVRMGLQLHKYIFGERRAT